MLQLLALPMLGQAFLVLYGDTYLRIDYGAVQRAFEASGQPALMTVLRNEGRWDTSNVVYRDGMVVRYDKHAPTPEMSCMTVVSRPVMNGTPRHSMLGRRCRGTISAMNGVIPSAK